MALPLLPLLGAAVRGAVGAGARGMAARGGMAGLRKTVAKKALGAAFEATGASRNPLISKAVDAAGRGYEAYKEHKESTKPQEHNHTIESDPRELREDENARRHEEAHQEGIQGETDKKFDESTAVLEVMANDISDIKAVIVGDSKNEDSFLGKMIKGFIGIVTLRLTSFLKPFRGIMSKVGTIIQGVTGFLKTVITALAKSTIGKALGLGALAASLDATAGPSNEPLTDGTREEPLTDGTREEPIAPSPSSNFDTAAALSMGPAGLVYLGGKYAAKRLGRRKTESVTPDVPTQSAPSPISPTSNGMLGGLSRRYESRGRSDAIGYDSTGGTSYGKYQIASNTGTMDNFLKFAKERSPEVYSRLSSAGPSNTGRAGGKFADEWKALSNEGKLGNLEHEFIRSTHYDVSRKGLKGNLGSLVDNSKALQEVLWSTSVQHGGSGGASIFNNSYKEGMSERDLISSVYARRRTQFGGSNANVRKSVMNRFDDESQRALSMLQSDGAPQGPALANAAAKEKAADRQANAAAIIPVIAPPAQQIAPIPSGSKGAAGPQTPMITHSPDGIVRALQLSYVAHSA